MAAVLTSLLMAGCSKDEVDPGDDDNGKTEGNTSYIAVNLVSSDATGTRATGGDYQDGTTTENKVNKVRFYFFTANGAAASVKLNGSSYVNYYDWEPPVSVAGNPGDIEKILKAKIVINTNEGDKLPQRIAAVLNPTESLGTASKSLSDLKDIEKDYAHADFTKEGTFVMFNSVYGSANKKTEICTVPIESENLQKDPDDAEANPVTIYVERSVAKVEVTLGDGAKNEETGMLALKDAKGNDLTVQGEQVYLKDVKWALTAESRRSRLVKDIDLEWEEPWWNGTHRSFWAINAVSATNNYKSYNAITATPTTLYTNENALDYDKDAPINRTKVILKGTLCKSDGTPFTIVRHVGSHFPDAAPDFSSLKRSILAQLTTSGRNYYSGDATTRNGLDINDLKITIVPQTPSEPSDGKARNCYVYAQLTDAAKTKRWYASSDKDVTETVTTEAIDGALADKDIVDRALVWNSGMTYYYFEIIHHRDENGSVENATKGVVRNHVYKTRVTKIAGFGTPVYDPAQVIYPEKPDPNDHYIAAQINILSWRIVNEDYELEW